ncbi:signal transduction histidine kinase [Stackebrandtia albiflava]|uniref:histidine kinase n=1 Tax=Stackebrandtia albiflava TaxID=406432 RepID=A0A562VBK3_9ACTN|nr:HAMP domain-containing sensor histidine kinase [Stackebrandtia albiflava]TWJ15265.1 signal transduction histidine kinase [Stackebrandtia albiflava]
MRWALAKVAIATTSMVALAFCIPLALVSRQVAEERAMAEARESAAAMVTVLAATDDPVALRRAVAADHAGAADRLAVHLPGHGVIGASHVDLAQVRRVSAAAETATVPGEGGVVYLRAVLLPGEQVAVVEVYIPDERLTHGVATAWWTLSIVAVLLVAISVGMADRLAAKVVRAATSLAAAATRLGAGDLTVRVRPAGPDELVEAGEAFNSMADRVVSVVDAERELVADLSHRLRTPLTALRLDGEALPDTPDGRRIRASVDALEAEVDAVIAGARRSVADRGPAHAQVAEILAERIALWGMLAEDYGRRFEVEGLDAPVWVRLSRDDVTSCLDALIGNVFAHTPQDAPFAVRLDPVAGRLAVEDGGPGIDDPISALTRGKSGAGSSGLGLDIVARMAKSTGGRLHIGVSELGGARIVWSFGDAVIDVAG